MGCIGQRIAAILAEEGHAPQRLMLCNLGRRFIEQGSVGELYRQFAVTLSTAVALSSLVALTLTPALCALLLRPRPARSAAVWRAFNRLLDGTRDGYGRLVGWMNRRPWLALAATVAAGALVAFSFTSMPKGFLPQEDQGYLFASVQLPEAASLERTEAVMAQARKLLMANPAVEDVIHRLDPDREVKTMYAEGLRECRKMLRIARTGKYDGYLLEGMACPGGCIAGAGTIQPPEKSRRVLEQYKASAPKDNPLDSDYKDDLYLLHDGEDDWSFVGRH